MGSEVEGDGLWLGGHKPVSCRNSSVTEWEMKLNGTQRLDSYL